MEGKKEGICINIKNIGLDNIVRIKGKDVKESRKGRSVDKSKKKRKLKGLRKIEKRGKEFLKEDGRGINVKVGERREMIELRMGKIWRKGRKKRN